MLCCAHQLAVIELYDATPRDLSIESIMLGRTQHSERLSSYSTMQLEVLTQSFYLQHAITGLGVSQTLQGITTKQLLLRTQHDQVGGQLGGQMDTREWLACAVSCSCVCHTQLAWGAEPVQAYASLGKACVLKAAAVQAYGCAGPCCLLHMHAADNT